MLLVLHSFLILTVLVYNNQQARIAHCSAGFFDITDQSIFHKWSEWKVLFLLLQLDIFFCDKQ